MARPVMCCYVWPCVGEICLIVVVISCVGEAQQSSRYYSNSYNVKIKKGSEEVVKLEAQRFSLLCYGKVVSNTYLFVDMFLPESMKTPTVNGSMHTLQQLLKDEILEVHQILLDRVTIHARDQSRRKGNQFLKKLEVQSPKSLPCYGMNVEQAWANNITGVGVKVAVVDSGVEMNHRDLKHNIKPQLSWNFFTNDSHVKPQRFPNYRERDEHSDHGNNIAGIIAAEKGNKVCSSGVAYNASLAILQTIQLSEKEHLFDLGQNDLHMHRALSFKNDMIDIYSVSINNVNPYRNPTPEMTEALERGTSEGRHGKGCIYVFSAGDDRDGLYDCNADSYINNVNTIAIGSVGINGSRPAHALRCSCILASTFWGTTTMQGTPLHTTSHDDSCSDGFSGSSASAALASGVIALLLQANSQLTWRDVQYLLVFTSTLKHLQDDINATTINSMGLKYHPYFGFGLMDAFALTVHARNWTTVPPRVTQTAVYIPKCEAGVTEKACDQQIFMAKTELPHCHGASDCISHLERVLVNVTYTTVSELTTELILRSPAGTLSKLKTQRRKRKTKSRHHKHAHRRTPKTTHYWSFQSVQFWGENPQGQWKLYMIVCSKLLKCYKDLGISHMEITLYGVSTLPLSSHLRSWYGTNNTTESAPPAAAPSASDHRQGEDMCLQLVDPETSDDCDQTTDDLITLFEPAADESGFPVKYFYIGAVFVFGTYVVGVIMMYMRMGNTPTVGMIISFVLFSVGLLSALVFYLRKSFMV